MKLDLRYSVSVAKKATSTNILRRPLYESVRCDGKIITEYTPSTSSTNFEIKAKGRSVYCQEINEASRAAYIHSKLSMSSAKQCKQLHNIWVSLSNHK